MRIRYGTDFSLIIPTRGRYNHLTKCLSSFFQTAAVSDSIEAIVLYDHDDETMDSFKEFIREHPTWKIIAISQPPSDRIVQNCNNFGAQCSNGKYLWMLNDECVCVTQDWDRKLALEIEIFLSDKPDRLLYVQINDDTYQADTESCCFPVLSKETTEVQSGIMPGEFHCHGADRAQFTIMQALSQKRILDLRHVINLENNANTNVLGKTGKDLGVDPTQSWVDEISKRSVFGQSDYVRYIKLLECHLQKTNS